MKLDKLVLFLGNFRRFLFVWTVPAIYILFELLFNANLIHGFSSYIADSSFDELRKQGQVMSSLGMFVAVMSIMSQKKNSFILSIVMAFVLSFAVYGGQRSFIEYAIDTYSTKHSLENAKYAYAAKSGYIQNKNISEITEIEPVKNTEHAKSVFAVFLPSILLLNDGLVDRIRTNNPNIIDYMVYDNINSNMDSVFSDYQTALNSKDDIWKRYRKDSKTYSSFVNNANSKTHELWASFDSKASKKYNDYKDVKRKFDNRVNKDMKARNTDLYKAMEKVFKSINYAFINPSSYSRCIEHEARSTQRARKSCVDNPRTSRVSTSTLLTAKGTILNIAAKAGKYAPYFKAMANRVPSIKPEDWCSRKAGIGYTQKRFYYDYRTYIGVKTRSGKYEQRFCEQVDSYRADAKKVKLLRQAFSDVTGVNYYNTISKQGFVKSDAVMSRFKSKINNSFGLHMTNSEMQTKNLFFRNFKRDIKTKALNKFRTGYGKKSFPNMSKKEFFSSNIVSSVIAKAMHIDGVSMPLSLNKGELKKFLSKNNIKIVSLNIKNSESDNAMYMKMSVIPVVGVILSLLFMLINVVMFIVSIFSIPFKKVRNNKTKIRTIYLFSLLVIPTLVFFIENPQTFNSSTDISYAMSLLVSWAIQMQYVI